MHDAFSRLYRLKVLLSSVLLMATGVVLIAIDRGLADSKSSWTTLLPWGEFGGILVGAGLLSVWLDHFFRREQEAIDDLRLRELLHEQAPVMRDAVLQAFAANHEDLARVATPEMLDQIITNSLALRLRDSQFADEIYRDVRDQVVAASERWYDASVSIQLSPLTMVSGIPSRDATASAAPTHFAVTVRWEYTTVPRHAQRRFVCLSDRDEYAELANERGATSAWYLKPNQDVEASSRKAFELLRFSVNGEDRLIRRTTRKQGQVYTASIGDEHIEAGQPVTVTYTYRTVTTQQGHLLFFDIEQPTRDLHLDFDYSDCGIASVSTLDLIPSIRQTRIELTPKSLPASMVRVDIDGWIFPRSGIAFVWTLETETHQSIRTMRSRVAR